MTAQSNTADPGAETQAYRCVGSITIARAASTQREIDALADPVTIDVSGVQKMDTVGAWVIYRTVRDRGARLVGARIIGLMSFLIGIVIAQQGAAQLRQFGAEIYTINLIGRLTLRELGTLMTAIMVAGRSGSLCRADRHDEADRGSRRDAHDRRLADGGAGGPARAG
jgi:hypothetical protein